MDAGQREHPEWIGVGLHTLTHIEDRTVAGQEIRDDPEIDEGILLDPAVAPRSAQDERQWPEHE